MEQNDNRTTRTYLRKTKKSWLVSPALGIGMSLCVMSVMAIAIIIATKRSTPTIPDRIKDNVSFPLYYPAPAPKMFAIEKGSFSSAPSVVTFSFLYDISKHLVISEQPLSGIDPSSFNPTKKFTTNIGTAYVVDMDDRTTAAVVGKKSWLLINAPQKISLSDLEDFIDSLRPVK